MHVLVYTGRVYNKLLNFLIYVTKRLKSSADHDELPKVYGVFVLLENNTCLASNQLCANLYKS